MGYQALKYGEFLQIGRDPENGEKLYYDTRLPERMTHVYPGEDMVMGLMLWWPLGWSWVNSGTQHSDPLSPPPGPSLQLRTCFTGFLQGQGGEGGT